MKKFLLTLLSIVVIAGALGGAGFVGYRYGYRQGISTKIAATNPNANPARPFSGRNDFGKNMMPFHNFNGMGPGFGMGPNMRQGFGMRGGRLMPFGMGFGFFGLFGLAIRVAIFLLIIWLVYKLLTGWRVSFTQVSNQRPIEVEPKSKPEEKSE